MSGCVYIRIWQFSLRSVTLSDNNIYSIRVKCYRPCNHITIIFALLYFASCSYYSANIEEI